MICLYFRSFYRKSSRRKSNFYSGIPEEYGISDKSIGYDQKSYHSDIKPKYRLPPMEEETRLGKKKKGLRGKKKNLNDF